MNENSLSLSGTLNQAGERPTVRLRRHLIDPPEVVWLALTDRERLRAWFPCDVMVDGGTWTVGAPITFAFGPDASNMTLTGKVLEVDRPRVLAFTWGEETLRFELLPAGDGGTDLVLDDQLPPAAAARNAAGWESCLDHLSGRAPAPGEWKRRFAAYTAAFEPAVGPQQGPPPEHRAGLVESDRG